MSWHRSAEFALPVHHRVPENLMKRTDCHNSHASEPRARSSASPAKLCTISAAASTLMTRVTSRPGIFKTISFPVISLAIPAIRTTPCAARSMPNFVDCAPFMWSISGRSHTRLTSGSTPPSTALAAYGDSPIRDDRVCSSRMYRTCAVPGLQIFD
jgi:hypothetical protein